jgi:hypothetical protein
MQPGHAAILSGAMQVGNVDMLNCYYAHGDEKGDSRLQRRCYWLLEADEDIVLVHYLNTAMVCAQDCFEAWFDGLRTVAMRRSPQGHQA